jgi:hypothetical protein
MPKKKLSKNDVALKAFIKSGGRDNAETDFNEILKRAVKHKRDSKPTKKTK